MKNSITECLSQMQDLTKKNLEILQSINDSFFTKQNHLTVNVGESKYVIPSFISLENKINALEENFTNLVNSPKLGEAYFNIDGNCRSIEVKSYTHTPNNITLNEIDKFDVNRNDIFKDFLTPTPFIKFDLSSIPNDITSVNVKKIVPKTNILKELFNSILSKKEVDVTTGVENVINLTSKSYSYGDIFKIISLYEEDLDFVEYESIYKLPIRKGIGNAVYVIKSVESDIIDNDLNNIITIKIDTEVPSDLYMNKFSYKLFDETIEKPLSVGDYVTTYDGSSKLQILELNPNTNVMKLLVVNGEYTNFIGTDSYNSTNHINDLSKIRFYSPINFDNDKYVNIPLEEDQFIFIAISPVNDRMNVQAPWGSGILLNTHLLSLSSDETKKFNEYYKNNVKNIGDILFEVSNILSSNTLSKLSNIELDKYNSFKPIIDKSDVFVTKINSHINDSQTILNIRSLYSQKKTYQTELVELQNKINAINDNLLKVSFDDVSGIKNTYNIQLNELNARKIELNNSITKIIDEISKSANNTEVPIENSKYRIRGFYNYLSEPLIKDHVIGIKVRYRYKNIEKEQGNTLSISGSNNMNFIFSDWNEMLVTKKARIPKYDLSGNLLVNWETDNFNENEPSINQIDIPISQGESVDVKLKVIYDFGAPFVETTSDWSDVVNFEFPTEYIKDIEILDIIKENNNDIETNRFTNILSNEGVISHINNKITDQDVIYFHNPNDIASGFYTDEKRVISLADKLNELNNSILGIQSEIYASNNNSLDIKLVAGDVVSPVIPWEENYIQVKSWNSIKSNEYTSYSKYNDVVKVILNIVLSNPSNIPIKLYPLFPGNSNTKLFSALRGKFDNFDYCYKDDDTAGVWIKNMSSNSNDYFLQTCNQFITFRVNDITDGRELYSDKSSIDFKQDGGFMLNILSRYKECCDLKNNIGAVLLPCVKNIKSLCANRQTTHISYFEIEPKQEISIPILFEYKLNGTENYVEKTLSFDLRTSLYQDPVNYLFKVVAKYEDTDIDQVFNTNMRYNNNAIKYNSTITL